MPSEVILNPDNPTVSFLCNRDSRLSKVISQIGTIKYTPHSDAYRFMLHEIIEQMLSVKAGTHIFNRLCELCNDDTSPSSISMLTDEQIRAIGTSGSKVRCIREFTNAILVGDLILDDFNNQSDEVVMSTLTSIYGIGNWTAKMYLIFVLDRQDILPYEDGAFIQSYKWLYATNDSSMQSIKEKCKMWKPYSSIASRYMYRALDTGLTKKEFHM